MARKELLAICTTLCVCAYLFLYVDSQIKQTKPVTKNQINLRQIQIGGKTRNNNRNNRVIKINNRVKVGKNKRTVKGKNNKKNKGNIGKVIPNPGFLSIQNDNLVFNSKKVFISGVNILYKNVGKDFGNGGYGAVKTQYESWLKEIADSGGNAIRILIHGDGNTTPMIDSQGFATGEDTASLIQELGQFLEAAQSYNIFAFLTLWSGALNMPANKLVLYTNDTKLDRYIDKVLKPLVSGLSTKKSLGAWEVITTPQATVRSNIVDSNPCFDTQNLFHQMAFLTTNNQTMENMQRFINRQLDAIKNADPKALRSLISKEEEAIEYCDWCYNYWQDKCLIAAGGKTNGVLDFYEFDAVATAGYDYYWSPLMKKPFDYKLGKPIIIAMSSGNCSDNKSGVTNFNNAFNWGYAGIFGWRYISGVKPVCNDSPAQCDAAMSAIRNNDIIKVLIK